MTARRTDRDPLVVLGDAARLLRTLADQRARAHGMTRAQWLILARVERQPGQSQNELASVLQVEPITVARLVDRLAARGLIERRSDPDDRRIWRLHLKPAAAGIMKKMGKARAALNDLLVEGISAEALSTTIDCLLKMTANMTAERHDAKSVQG